MTRRNVFSASDEASKRGVAFPLLFFLFLFLFSRRFRAGNEIRVMRKSIAGETGDPSSFFGGGDSFSSSFLLSDAKRSRRPLCRRLPMPTTAPPSLPTATASSFRWAKLFYFFLPVDLMVGLDFQMNNAVTSIFGYTIEDLLDTSCRTIIQLLRKKKQRKLIKDRMQVCKCHLAKAFYVD